MAHATRPAGWRRGARPSTIERERSQKALDDEQSRVPVCTRTRTSSYLGRGRKLGRVLGQRQQARLGRRECVAAWCVCVCVCVLCVFLGEGLWGEQARVGAQQRRERRDTSSSSRAQRSRTGAARTARAHSATGRSPTCQWPQSTRRRRGALSPSPMASGRAQPRPGPGHFGSCHFPNGAGPCRCRPGRALSMPAVAWRLPG